MGGGRREEERGEERGSWETPPALYSSPLSTPSTASAHASSPFPVGVDASPPIGERSD